MKQYIILVIVFLFIITSISFSQQEDIRLEKTNPNYEEGDWISYSMTRWIISLAQGIENVYFATTGGISRYN